MRNHTPGPWAWITENEQIVGADGEIVVYELNTSAADACLIAAAPELLEACKWLIAYHDSDAPITTLEEYLSRARAAVARAESDAQVSGVACREEGK